MDKVEIIETIEKLANENHVMCDVYEEHGGVIAAEIQWGDWKHSHLRLKWLVKEKFPDMRGVETEVTEEDGSDCYSAIHRFCF